MCLTDKKKKIMKLGKLLLTEGKYEKYLNVPIETFIYYKRKMEQSFPREYLTKDAYYLCR